MTDITDAGPRLRAMNDMLQDDTPAAHATPTEGSKQNGCTLTHAEREAIAWAAGWLSGGRADPPAGGKDALWSLLARLSPPAT